MSDNEIIIHILRKGGTEMQRYIYSNSDWFQSAEYFIINDSGEYLNIKKCYLDVPKKAYKLSKNNSLGGCLGKLPIGRFYADSDESNEDELMIYYKEQIKCH